ncbi:MAG TPA: hypothetical protein VGM19_02160 [Armatimonadota bacterium]|jgi:hypothetical protein
MHHILATIIAGFNQRRILAVLAGALALAGVAALAAHLLPPSSLPRAYLPPAPGSARYEAWAAAQFAQRHPGEQPLNWRLARTAERFYRQQPMGKFVLSVTPGQWGNDCSDFVDCVVDEALGAGARCLRPGQRNHTLGSEASCFRYFVGAGRAPALPGDLVQVRHSPWYERSETACWHVGIVGADGMVYDFVKLMRWDQARYGRHPYAWFVAHSTGPREVIIGRLRPEYRYRLREISLPPRGSLLP